MTPAEIAAALWDARMRGETIELDDADKPADTAAAYTIQTIQTAESGAAQIGWKLGATNDKALVMLELDDAFAGTLLAPFRFGNGACIELPVSQTPALETEFLVKLASDLPVREQPYSRDEVAPAVDYVAPSFEIVGCRLPGGLANGGRVVIADSAGNIAYVEGARGEEWRAIDLATCELSVTINGEEEARGTGSLLTWGDPLAAVGWLATHPLVVQRGLRAGDIVMTGTCGGILPLSPGDEARADFGALGVVEASFR